MVNSRSKNKKNVTRNDVAALAGVAPSSVSYVINNGPRPVSQAARERVLKAIAELNYHPSDLARSLRTQQSKTLGLMIPNVTDPFFAEIACAVEEVSFEQDYTVILAHSSDSPEREMQYAQVLRSKQVDGAIIHLVSSDPEPARFLEQAGIRTVVLERTLPGFHCFVADDRRGAYLATQHLLDLGHTRIAYIARAGDFAHSAERVEGFRQALDARNVPVNQQLIVSSKFGYGAAATVCRQLLNLPYPPTAILAHDDITAIGAIRALADAGLNVPNDMSIVGFDNISQAAYTVPPLTTVSYPRHEMGCAAVELLLRLLTDEDVIPPTTKVLPVELVVRASTAPPRSL